MEKLVNRLSKIGLFSLCQFIIAGCDTFICSLEVTKGTGSGEYSLTEIVSITADEPPHNYAFDQWIGTNVDCIADVTEPETTIVMPAGYIQIEATYRLVACTMVVEYGTGSGTYAPNQTVEISATAPVSGYEFDRWVGDVGGIANVNQATTTIVVNQADIIIGATYKAKATPPPSSPTTPTQIPYGTSTAFVPGNKTKDGGSTVYTYISGMDVRLLANDGSKISCINGWYFISASIIKSTGAFTVARSANGDAVVTGHDFTSPSSGLHYQFAGWTVHSSSSPLVRSNPLVIANAELHNTLRGYWATVRD